MLSILSILSKPANANALTDGRVTRASHDDVVQQFCRKLLGFSLGRAVQFSDIPLLTEMQRNLEANQYRFSVAVESIVTSRQFRGIRGKMAAQDH